MENIEIITEENTSSLDSQISISNDKYIRLLAEFDNYKKRVTKEKEDIRNNTKSMMISSILDLDSDLSLAKKQIKDDGIDLIMSKLEKFLNSQGIQSIQTTNYDSDIHEVVSMINQNSKNIIDVVSKGYILDGKVIRYPKVILG